MSQKKTTLVSGVAILSIAGLISKVIGMFFRIPLANLIGLDGIGVYQTVYPAYTLLLTLSTAGVPVAISRMVAERVTLGRHREARALLQTALWVLFGVGLALTLGLVAISGMLATWVGDPEAAIGYIAIAPSIMIVSVMSALRGYMQGRSNMRPTAISQLIEQLGKVVVALPLAALGLRYGLAYASAGALVGISIAEAVALLYMALIYRSKRRLFAVDEATDSHAASSRKELLKQIIVIAIPITIGSLVVPLSGFVDSAMIRQRLFVAGIGEEQARILYGALSGNAVSLANLPTVLATAVCMGLVPLISAARVEKRKEDMWESSQLGLRLGSLIGLPCTIGMSLLATPIIHLLYAAYTPAEVALSGEILSLSALTIFFFSQVQATTGILQGAGLQKIPMYSLALGVGFKIVLNYILIAIPSLNIYGAPIASLTCYGVSLAVNLVFIMRRTGLRVHWGQVLVRPAGATLGMAAAVWLCMQVLDMNSRVNTLLAIFAGVAVYGVLVFALGALRREDMEAIPGGRKIEKLMMKLRVWKAAA